MTALLLDEEGSLPAEKKGEKLLQKPKIVIGIWYNNIINTEPSGSVNRLLTLINQRQKQLTISWENSYFLIQFAIISVGNSSIEVRMCIHLQFGILDSLVAKMLKELR